jgi:hypothetical protein
MVFPGLPAAGVKKSLCSESDRLSSLAPYFRAYG